MVTYLHVRARSERMVAGRLHVGTLVFPCIIGPVRPGLPQTRRRWQDAGGAVLVATRLLSRRPPGTPCAMVFAPGFATQRRLVRGAKSGHYNRHVKLPFRDGHETMWRDDEAYDVVFATSHNERPRVKGAGSAIFFHLTRKDSAVTAGCVAISKADMSKILSRCGRKVMLAVWPGQGVL